MAQALLLVAMILVNWPLHAQESADTLACDSMAFLDLSTIEYVPGELILAIREGNDEIVAQLRLASERETVEIGLPSWDELSADMGLRAIGAFEEYTDLTRRLFLLIFPEESDLQQVITSYCAFPYVEYVDLNEVLRNFEHVSPNEVLRISVTQQATWGMVKLEGHLRRFPK